MKKILFVLCSALISNSLFSDPIFCEETYREIVNEYINHEFLENVTEDVSSLNYLSYIAGVYLEVLSKVESFKNEFSMLDRYVISQDVSDIRAQFRFSEDNNDLFYVPYVFQKMMEIWVNKSKTAKVEETGELTIPIDRSNPAGVGEEVGTMFSFSNDVKAFEICEAKAFAQALMEVSGERAKTIQCAHRILKGMAAKGLGAFDTEIKALMLKGKKKIVFKVEEIPGFLNDICDDQKYIDAKQNSVADINLISRKIILVALKGGVASSSIVSIASFSSAARLICLYPSTLLNSFDYILGVENLVVGGAVGMATFMGGAIVAVMGETFIKKFIEKNKLKKQQ